MTTLDNRSRSVTPVRAWLADRQRLRRSIAAAAVVVVATGGAALGTQAAAQPATLKVSGTFDNQLVTGPSCTAPAGLCIEGKFHGTISGPDEGVVNSVTPTAQQDVVLGDAAVTIHTRHGDLNFAHEQFVYNTAPGGKGEFSWLLEITSGTGRYANATGYLQGVGNAPPSTGASDGTYVGEIKLH